MLRRFTLASAYDLPTGQAHHSVVQRSIGTEPSRHLILPELRVVRERTLSDSAAYGRYTLRSSPASRKSKGTLRFEKCHVLEISTGSGNPFFDMIISGK